MLGVGGCQQMGVWGFGSMVNNMAFLLLCLKVCVHICHESDWVWGWSGLECKSTDRGTECFGVRVWLITCRFIVVL